MPSKPLRPAVAILSVLVATAAVAGCTAQDPAERTIAVDTAENPAVDAIALAAGSSDAEVDAAIDRAVEGLPDIVDAAMEESGVPGAAVAVVHGGEVVYSDGFGVKLVGEDDPIDDETVFQIASVSKSLSATVVARAITEGVITWDTPVSEAMPGFALSDPYVTSHATVGDYFAHRSGLATGAGDDLEDLGYDRAYILDHLRLQPLSAFRSTYNYSNFGITIGAEATADALGMSWEDAAERLLYEPLGMSATSSRYDDFLAQRNRATIHEFVDGEFQPLYERDPDPQSPAGGVSSNVIDLAAWMNMVLAGGSASGEELIDGEALVAATTGEMISGHPDAYTARTSMYGYGFNVGTQLNGRTSFSHSGAFILGAATNFQMVPSLDLGIVTLTNGGPQGVPEAIDAAFLDLVQYGHVTRDWESAYAAAMAHYYDPEGDLVGQEPPADASAPGAAADYAGTYTNDYFGDLVITAAEDGLAGAMGPDGQYPLDLSPWNGDMFSFVPTSENSPPGSLSSAAFSRDGGAVTSVTMAYFDRYGLGTWQKVSP